MRLDVCTGRCVVSIDVSDLLRDFTKKEIMTVAGELELVIDDTRQVRGARGVVASILHDLEQNGVPEMGDSSDLMLEFLVSAEFIDDDGNLLEQAQSTITETETEEVKEHKCFGYYDVRDPACKRCTHESSCSEAREDSRPECFGVMFLLSDPECDSCIEANACRQEEVT